MTGDNVFSRAETQAPSNLFESVLRSDWKHPQGGGGRAIESQINSALTAAKDCLAGVLPHQATGTLPKLDIAYGERWAANEHIMPSPWDRKDQSYRSYDQFSEFPVRQEREIAAVQTLLDNAEILSGKRSDGDVYSDAEAALLIDKNGNIRINHGRTIRDRLDDQLLIEFETDSPVSALTIEQKSAMRDIISYLRMYNPDLSIPDSWITVMDSALLPPIMRGEDDGSASGGYYPLALRKGYGRSTGIRSNDGTGFAGAGGKTSSIVPSSFDHTGNKMDIRLDKSGKLVDSLQLNNFVDKVVHAVSGNEGKFTSINRNDAGYGISVGIRQWNQQVGELPTLLKAWNKNNGKEFQEIFGDKYASKLLNERWVRNADMASDADLMKRMDRALHDKGMQKTQVDLARGFVKSAVKLGHDHGFKSELGLALVCDMVNQTGTGGTKKALCRAGLERGGTIDNESEAVHRLASASKRPGGHHRFAHLQKSFSAGTKPDIHLA